MNDPAPRDAARRAGWTGPLRGELVHTGAAGWPGSVAAAVQALVPGAHVTERDPGGTFKRLVRMSVTGRSDAAELQVQDGLGSFTLRYPHRPDLWVERLARVVDVAVGMRARFGPSVRHVRLISIDSSSHGFITHRHAGHAVEVVGDIHVNASLFVPAEDELRLLHGKPGGAARVPPPYDKVDSTVAHELWHQIEALFVGRRYRESIEFRRMLGAHFGVETLEHAVMHPGPARDRVAAEVSPYAATKVGEATAEMAAVWWCTREAPDPPPVARAFAAAVDAFFPPTPRPPR